jgi:hypothetical protein
MKRLTILIALMLICAQVTAFAQITAVPPMMHFQGRLTRPDGTPVPDGNYSIRFSLWTAISGGTEKWNQTINPVTVKKGTFAVPLNTATGAADKFNNNLFLEIKIGTDAPLTPRQLLTSVAYAMKADSVKDGSITSNSLATSAVTGAKIADNAITTAKLANGSVTSAKLDSSLQGKLGGFTSDNTHLGINSNLAVRGGGFFYSGLDLDQGNLNNGGLASGLTFGHASGEGIASKRTFGGNGLGLDFYTAYQNRITIMNNGYVGIGTTTPGSLLEVNGTVAAPFFFTTSDARYKQNVATLENPLETILNLRGVTYDWKQKEFPDKNFTAGRQIGFIAQEVEKVLPELVITDAQGYKRVAYANVVPVMVEAMKQQQQQRNQLSAENTAQKQQLAELSELVRQIQAAQEALRANTSGK